MELLVERLARREPINSKVWLRFTRRRHRADCWTLWKLSAGTRPVHFTYSLLPHAAGLDEVRRAASALSQPLLSRREDDDALVTVARRLM